MVTLHVTFGAIFSKDRFKMHTLFQCALITETLDVKANYMLNTNIFGVGFNNNNNTSKLSDRTTPLAK